jgi:pyruvate formate lyase activating enzyme
MRDVAISAKENDLHTVVVSNGYVNREPLEEISRFTDAFNIDLKAFSNTFYKKLTGADIEPVKSSLKQIAKSGKHLEITSLIIPGMNDNDEEMHSMSEWIAEELGEDVPLHLSRYYPMYKRADPSTPAETLLRLHSIASEKLKYVYLGNINANTGQDSLCPVCGTVVTKRTGYRITLSNLNTKGECTECGTKIYKYFTMPSQIKN